MQIQYKKNNNSVIFFQKLEIKIQIPQVDVQIIEWNCADISAGATGGKLKPTPAVEAIAPRR